MSETPNSPWQPAAKSLATLAVTIAAQQAWSWYRKRQARKQKEAAAKAKVTAQWVRIQRTVDAIIKRAEASK